MILGAAAFTALSAPATAPSNVNPPPLPPEARRAIRFLSDGPDSLPGLPCRFPVESLAQIARLIDQYGMNMFSLAGKTFVDAISHPDNAAPETQARMIGTEPVLVGIPMVDLHLAAAAEDIAWRNGIQVPAWALDPKRFAPEPQLFGRNAKMQQFNVEYTPEPWRRRNLFFGEVVLWSVRWGETLEQRLLKIQSGALRERPKAENCRAASRPATSTLQPTA